MLYMEIFNTEGLSILLRAPQKALQQSKYLQETTVFEWKLSEIQIYSDH